MVQNKKRKPTTTLILVMMAVVVIGVLIARSYYQNVNASADPRILPARLAYQEYNQLAASGDYLGVLDVLNEIDSIYSGVAHYDSSYEPGVVHANRSAVFLTIGLHIDSLRVTNKLGWMADYTKMGLMNLGEEEVLKAIHLYTHWDSIWGDLSEEEIELKLEDNFLDGLEDYEEEEQENFLKNRKEEILLAQLENDRRLSVAYTNLGMVFFHRNDYETAADYFNQAVELWEDNMNAKNNLNRMLGRPLEKRNIIQKLFPKSRKEKDG